VAYERVKPTYFVIRPLEINKYKKSFDAELTVLLTASLNTTGTYYMIEVTWLITVVGGFTVPVFLCKRVTQMPLFCLPYRKFIFFLSLPHPKKAFRKHFYFIIFLFETQYPKRYS
jgi:hypothetical protein